MNSPSKSQQLYLRYLLDQLPLEERERVDDALITDQKFSNSFQEARYDLIDAYVANELPIDVRKQVEQGILSTTGGRSAFSSAIAIQKYGSATRANTVKSDYRNPKTSIWPIHRRTFRITFLASALAACFVLAAVWIAVRVDVQKINAPVMRSSLPPEASTSKQDLEASTGSRSAEPVAPGSIVRSSSLHPKSRSTDVLAFVMPMGTTRGSSQIPLQIYSGIHRIQVQWPLPSDATASNYTLEISSSGSGITMLPQQGPLLIVGTTRVAKFLLHADTLPNGEYNFRLRTNDASSKAPLAESSVLVSH